jgi:hypothetical protein
MNSTSERVGSPEKSMVLGFAQPESSTRTATAAASILFIPGNLLLSVACTAHYTGLLCRGKAKKSHKKHAPGRKNQKMAQNLPAGGIPAGRFLIFIRRLSSCS